MGQTKQYKTVLAEAHSQMFLGSTMDWNLIFWLSITKIIFPLTRLPVVSNFRDGDCGAGKIHAGAKVQEDATRREHRTFVHTCISPAPQSPLPKLDTTHSLSMDKYFGSSRKRNLSQKLILLCLNQKRIADLESHVHLLLAWHHAWRTWQFPYPDKYFPHYFTPTYIFKHTAKIE